jgi:hypothetical protein
MESVGPLVPGSRSEHLQDKAPWLTLSQAALLSEAILSQPQAELRFVNPIRMAPGDRFSLKSGGRHDNVQ